jgi:hypothetical protein
LLQPDFFYPAKPLSKRKQFDCAAVPPTNFASQKLELLALNILPAAALQTKSKSESKPHQQNGKAIPEFPKEYQTANLSKLIVIFIDRSNQYPCELPQLHQQLNERNRGRRKFPGATARLTLLPDDINSGYTGMMGSGEWGVSVYSGSQESKVLFLRGPMPCLPNALRGPVCPARAKNTSCY